MLFLFKILIVKGGSPWWRTIFQHRHSLHSSPAIRDTRLRLERKAHCGSKTAAVRLRCATHACALKGSSAL
jgi:hypothetical protein